MKRPLGLALIAFYSAIFGIASLPVGCTVMMASSVQGAGVLVPTLGFVVASLGLLGLVSAYGIWTTQSWGGVFTSWVYAASIPLGILFMFPIMPMQGATLGNALLQLIGIGIDVMIIGYLALPTIKQCFGETILTTENGDYERIEPR